MRCGTAQRDFEAVGGRWAAVFLPFLLLTLCLPCNLCVPSRQCGCRAARLRRRHQALHGRGAALGGGGAAGGAGGRHGQGARAAGAGENGGGCHAERETRRRQEPQHSWACCLPPCTVVLAHSYHPACLPCPAAPVQARLRNPKTAALWLAAVRTELRAGNAKAADALMAKALQECPDSGPLWAESISMVPRPQRKSRSVDALKRCNDDPHVVAAVAALFWHDRKVDKARSWLNRAVTLNPGAGGGGRPGGGRKWWGVRSG